MRTLISIVILLGLGAGAAARQPGANAPVRAAQAELPALRMDAPFSIPNMGLSVYLPEESLIDLSQIEGKTKAVISPAGQERQWVFQIHNSVSTDRSMTLAQAIENIVDQRRRAYTTKDERGRTVTAVREFDRDDSLIIGRTPAQRIYVDVPLDQSAVATGYTVFQLSPSQFVIFQMDCPVSAFPKVRALYELMVASAQFRDPEEVGADRAAAILAGESVMQAFNSADYEGALDPEPVLYRIFRPSPTGAAADDEEVGYQRVHLRAGQAGELDPRKAREHWTKADEQAGYLARIEARALNAGSVVDTVSVFFLSQDKASELWSITMVVRQGRDSEQWIETGIRRGSRLTVKTSRTGAEPTSADWSPLPKGYTSRVEAYLFPRLAVKAATPGIFGFYNYESSLAKMTLRRETLAQNPATSTWVMATLISENSNPVRTDFDASGKIIRRILPDGQVMEPVEAARLKRLWADKKLPLE